MQWVARPSRRRSRWLIEEIRVCHAIRAKPTTWHHDADEVRARGHDTKPEKVSCDAMTKETRLPGAWRKDRRWPPAPVPQL